MVNETFTLSEAEPDEVLLSIYHVAERLNRTRRTINNWLADDAVKFPRPRLIRGKIYFAEADLARWERRFPDRLLGEQAA
jgi:hypothetical protein